MAFPISVHILDSLNFFDALNNLFSLFFPSYRVALLLLIVLCRVIKHAVNIGGCVRTYLDS